MDGSLDLPIIIDRCTILGPIHLQRFESMIRGNNVQASSTFNHTHCPNNTKRHHCKDTRYMVRGKCVVFMLQNAPPPKIYIQRGILTEYADPNAQYATLRNIQIPSVVQMLFKSSPITSCIDPAGGSLGTKSLFLAPPLQCTPCTPSSHNHPSIASRRCSTSGLHNACSPCNSRDRSFA